jgi:peptidoglycan/xylan/chitin deacetylase (PgdA/CDA1 family)
MNNATLKKTLVPEDSECLVVMYHYVRPEYTGEGLFGVTPKEFENQILALKSTYTILHPHDFISCIRNETSLPRKSCLLTFDDGLKDHVNYVAPILSSHKASGIFFVLSKPLAENKMVEIHKIHLLRQKIGETSFREKMTERLPADMVGDHYQETASSDVEHGYVWDRDDVAQFKAFLNYRLPYPALEMAVAGLFAEHFDDEPECCREFYLASRDITEMEQAGMVFGGHGHGHKIYSRMDAGEQERDIDANLSFLKNEIGVSVKTFAYPFGQRSTFDQHTIEHLVKRDIFCAFSTSRGAVDREDGLYALKRIDPKDIPC